MSVSEFVSTDPTLAQTLRRHLDGLRRSGNGSGLIRLLERGLGLDEAGVGRQVGSASVSRLHAQLGAYASDGDNPPALRIKARVIQQHIAPYLAPTVSVSMHGNPFQSYIDAINGIGSPASPAPLESVVVDRQPSEVVCGTSEAGGLPASRRAPVVEGESGSNDADLAEWLDGALDDRPAGDRGEQRYEALRRSELGAWRAIYGAIKDFRSLKQLWAGSLDELRRERVDLEQQLASAADRLKSVESDRERLRTELDRVRRRSARVSRLPPPARMGSKRPRRAAVLPRREAFLEQLASEIERVRRHTGSLAVALIGLRDLDVLIDHHGESVEPAILRCYAEEILSGFRTYDYIASYDRHQFAVLFPGAQRDGAVRALAKAQKRAAETHLTLEGESVALPAFFSAVSLLAAGEDAGALMERVASAAEDARLAPPPHVLFVEMRTAPMEPGTFP